MNETRHKLASRGKRLGGSLLDALISIVIIIPIMFATGIIDQITAGQAISIRQTIFLFILGLAVFLIIHGYLLSKYGQTVGKKIVGTRIVGQDHGQVLPLGNIFFMRVLPLSLVGQIPIIGSLFGLADTLFIFRDDKRCIHDLIAGTVVVDAD